MQPPPTGVPSGPGAAESAESAAPFLSIVIPAYNEARRLPTTLATVWAYLERQPYTAEVIVVDDGSDDDTAAKVETLITEETPTRLIRNPHMGKGVAVRTGMLAGRGRYILYSDADFSTPIDEIEKLLPWLEQRGYDVAIG